MSLNDALQRLSSEGTSSLIFVSARLSGRTLSTCVAKERNGCNACPLTK